MSTTSTSKSGYTVEKLDTNDSNQVITRLDDAIDKLRKMASKDAAGSNVSFTAHSGKSYATQRSPYYSHSNSTASEDDSSINRPINIADEEIFANSLRKTPTSPAQTSNTHQTFYSSLPRDSQYSATIRSREISPQMSPLSSGSSTTNKQSRTRNVTTTRTITSIADTLPSGESETLSITPEALDQIKQHISESNRVIKELQDQLRIVPQLQERIKGLKEDKKSLAHQLQSKSTISSMRSVGVGDFDVDEDQVKIEKVIQTVVQEAPKQPCISVGVGAYDVTQQLFTEADVLHTVAESVKHVREKEIQTWIKDAEDQYNRRKSGMRSFGVGDADIWEEENRLIKEKEMRTILLAQNEKPEQRNVGVQIKPSMRDVCIEYSLPVDTPLTRTCGFNVDIGDIIQEMTSQQAVELTGQQQAQNSWAIQKHVIQRKFMDAMSHGNPEDLVNFITTLLKKSVRSVGVMAKPTTADFGMGASSSSCSVGVGDDVIDVVVKPFVHMKDAFALAKPSIRTQPTWTDLVLTCDAGTNTQTRVFDKSVNTEAPEEHKSDYSSSLEQHITYSSSSKSRPPSVSRYLGTSSNLLPEYQTEEKTRRGSDSRTETVTQTTVTERVNKPQYHSQMKKQIISTPTPVEVDIKLPEEVTRVEKTITTHHSSIDKRISPPPTTLELDIKLPPEVLKTEKTTTLRTQTSVADSAPESHLTQMHMILPGRPDELTPLAVQVLPHLTTGSAEFVASTHTLEASGHRAASEPGSIAVCDSGSILKPSSSVTKKVVSETTPYSTFKETTELLEGGDTTKKEYTIERTYKSGSSHTRTLSPSHLHTRVLSPSRLPSANISSNYGLPFSTKTSTTRTTGSFRHRDNVGEGSLGPKPRGHADRMERYSEMTPYITSEKSVDEERNKTELHGDPLKSRYSIDEVSNSTLETVAVISPSSPTSKRKEVVRKQSVTFSDQNGRRVNFGQEYDAACRVLMDYIKGGKKEQSSKVAAAASLIQEKWFEIAGTARVDIDHLVSTINYFSQYSNALLDLVVNMVDGNGNTVLHYAVSHGNHEVIRCLLKTGLVNCSKLNKAGFSPIMLAAISDVQSEEEKTAVKLLLKEGNVNMASSQAGQTPLMLAALHGRDTLVNMLLEAGADVNAQDFDGSTALMVSAEHNNKNIAQVLLRQPSVNVLLKDRDGSTALDIALDNGHEELAEILEAQEKAAKSRNANLRSQRSSTRSPTTRLHTYKST